MTADQAPDPTPTTRTGEYDEALTRLHAFGPEFEGYLSNHGPMVVEALWRRDAGRSIHRWTGDYVRRLEPAPGPGRPVTDWREALGDAGRTSDWLTHFRVALAEEPWTDVLATWWPRLLPGIAAGATHGVIRVGHAVEGLRAAETAPRLAELAHALGYWAARWQPVPVTEPRGRLDPLAALAAVPTVSDQAGGIRPRLAQLPGTSGYDDAVASVAVDRTAGGAGAAIDRVVDAAVLGYARWAAGSPTMLVHAATAPNAVRRVLPSLPDAMVGPSVDAAWSATAAVVAAYRPAVELPRGPRLTPDDVVDAAVAHGSEHVVKFADTALDSWRRTGDDRALEAVATAVRLDA